VTRLHLRHLAAGHHHRRRRGRSCRHRHGGNRRHDRRHGSGNLLRSGLLCRRPRCLSGPATYSRIETTGGKPAGQVMNRFTLLDGSALLRAGCRRIISDRRPDAPRHSPGNTVRRRFENEVFPMIAILEEWRAGYRFLFAPVLMLAGLAGCAVGPDFVAPLSPRETNYVMGQTVTVSAKASGSTTQQIHLGGVLDADWWTRLRSPGLDRTVTLALSSNRTLEVARADLSKASEGIKVASVGLFPQFDATGEQYRRARPSEHETADSPWAGLR
jgi:hypothetical protein